MRITEFLKSLRQQAVQLLRVISGKSEQRQMAAAIGGDYYATGNSNLSAASGSFIGP
jgi:hypothetical protein